MPNLLQKPKKSANFTKKKHQEFKLVASYGVQMMNDVRSEELS